jgi:hypothetical protein
MYSRYPRAGAWRQVSWWNNLRRHGKGGRDRKTEYEAGEKVKCQNPPNGIYKANWDVRGAGCGPPTDGHA